MNGAHDLGGMHGLGPISAEPESQEPVFHADWEKLAFGLNLATAALGRWNIDMSRSSRERQHPVDYLMHSYYENWVAGLETLLLEAGLISDEELRSGRAEGLADAATRARVIGVEQVRDSLARWARSNREIEGEPRFKPGDRVRAINQHPEGHTREPRYLRGHVGVVHEHYGAHLFPDLSAQRVLERHHLYSVRFESDELWGASAAGRSAVYADLWEDYLEPGG